MDLFLFHSHQACGKMETDKGEGDFVDCTPVELAEFFFIKWTCAGEKKGDKKEIKWSDTDLGGGDSDVEREISNPRDDVSWPHDGKKAQQMK